MLCSHGVAPRSSALLSVLLLVLIVTMTTGESNKTEGGRIILKNEKPCLSEGGICVAYSSCAEENRLNQSQLCPQQDGAVCCSGVPEEVMSCRLHGGRCGQEEECRNVQNFGQLDCNEGSQCCLLIF